MDKFTLHCVWGLIVRFLLIIYAKFHDRFISPPFTDIDYHVFTDAARFMVNGTSPYNRHTYRYTPFLAAILTPNIYLHGDFGKALFSVVDIIVAVIMKSILTKIIATMPNPKGDPVKLTLKWWLWNPLSFVITTRGNADTIASLLVLSTIYNLQKDRTFVGGLLHGLSIHFRLYPIVFSLSMYLSLGRKKILPNVEQIKLVLGCLLSLLILTSLSYYLYGYQYLYQSVIYHLTRKDPRHNFSIWFYTTYLSIGQPSDFVQRLIALLPQLVVLVALSFRFSSKEDLPFAMFTQALVMVTYNSVITSQYFFWFLSLLPLCLPKINMPNKVFFRVMSIWITAQDLWLFCAYLLEYHGVNCFQHLWVTSMFFFHANVNVINAAIRHYDVPIKNE